MNKKSILLFLPFLFFAIIGIAQTPKTITGTVLSSGDNLPLPGASVIVKGSTPIVGAVTDFDGEFSLDVAADATTLVVSYVGFQSQEVAISDSPLTIVLKEGTFFDEVVVVAYGTQKKSLVTGAISSIKSSDIESTPALRIEQALQGKTSGVTILPNSGSPGSGIKVRIRGVSSNGKSDPLYIVDGMKTGNIDNIEPNDIESIEVLKDAASAAIYGTEGANGVIMVTTKSGKAGKAEINYSFQYGTQSVNTKMDLMNAQEYTDFMQESGAGTISNPDGTDTDWLDAIFETAPMQKHHLNFSGGNEKSTYMISGSYYNQDGVVGGSKANFERFTARINSKHKIKEWLEIGNTFSYSNINKSTITEDDEYRGILNNALLIDPITPVTESGITTRISEAINDGHTILQDENGNYYGMPRYVTGEAGNPIALLKTFNGGITQDKILGTFFAKLSPIEGLNITSRFGIDLTYQVNHIWSSKFYFSPERNNTSNTIDDDIDKWFTWLWENFATYNKKINDHDFTILAGYSSERYQHPNYSLHSGPMPQEGGNYAYHDYRTSQESDKVGGGLEENAKISYFGRLSYNFKHQYMFEASLRYDEASVLPEHNKGAFFPAFSAGWAVSEENFWSVEKIDYFKLRASWGKNGSISNVIENEDKEFWTTENIYYIDGEGNYISGARVGKITNPNLEWEKSNQLDIGFDLKAFDGKLSFSTDYYIKKTEGLIFLNTFASSVGRDAPYFNGGTVENKGFDFETSFRNKIGDLSYRVNFNLSTLNNEVTELTSKTFQSGANVRGYDVTMFDVNEPIWYFYGYKTNGIDDATGEVIVVDVNGDGSITPDDQTNIGNPHPDLIYGGSINLEYKNFDLNIFLQGTKGNDIYMAWFRMDRIFSNKPSFFYNDRWTEAGDNASMPKPNNESDDVYRSDLMVQDGSYMRIKQIQLGYSLPKSILKRTGGLEKVRAYISLDDYFTFTKYKGLDPEVGSEDDNSQGIDRGAYPIPRKFMFGLSVNF